MKRTWHCNYYLSKPKIEFTFSFMPPSEDDYFKHQWQLYIVFLGSFFTLGTWKE